MNLPGILAEIAAVAGDGAALALARARGGTEIEVPKNPHPDCQLARIVGLDAARAIAREIGHGRLAIPMAALRGPAARRAAAAAMSDKGASAVTVALSCDMSTRTVRRIRRRLRRPLPLFDAGG
ncbi:helix-turn-helix domain-containing protein [Varunaivibrio sulfuroxidans]|uniref:Homeodomain-like domain-containing protein n=1 Tax=Varunaivibrio sulfuroxidans TaxID=1773489 RepID=A0A4R3J9E2_9PROT|nr:helix-turn-helix domain-containing protein [Varunaivibrio sulfuroxidans]TCS62569.1 Homeodomain-like domain-containing protein [Varunaivibrio sulfuroxidans]WES30762.1 helix-turn-helix domain-containing protein [Varunaivibrio sulfuroxidans]